MIYRLSDINAAVASDAAAYAAECDGQYTERVQQAARQICANMKESPIVLLSGPSGSGKTTSAGKLEQELERMGVEAHTVSLDDYFLDVQPELTPRTPTGEYDLESPLCLDMELLNSHFTMLSQGQEIEIPRFDFPSQSRTLSTGRRMRLGKDEVAIFEGIHALNDHITGVHPEAFKLFVSADSLVDTGSEFHRRWVRLVRRLVRDARFRSTNAAGTMAMYHNIQRGEELYILPYKPRADMMLDSFLPYELSVFAGFAPQELEAAGDARLEPVIAMLRLFEPMDVRYVPEQSLLHEFIG